MGAAASEWGLLDGPFQRCLELAWESARHGSLGIGAVITDGEGTIVAEGRNRLMEDDAGEDALAATPIAHAEMNALAKLRWGTPHDAHVLWTSLEPCVLCAGGIRLAGIGSVRYLAPDPIWEGAHRMRELCTNAPDRWAVADGPRAGPFSAFGVLLPMHLTAFWMGAGGMPPVWVDRLPGVTALACELAAEGELVRLADDGADVVEVLDTLWARLCDAAGPAQDASR